MASGEMIVNGIDTVDFMAGFDKSVLSGGDGDDWMVHFGSGGLKGGAGNDSLFAIAPTVVGPDDVLEMRGEEATTSSPCLVATVASCTVARARTS